MNSIASMCLVTDTLKSSDIQKKKNALSLKWAPYHMFSDRTLISNNCIIRDNQKRFDLKNLTLGVVSR